jgi:hypothetical protein
MTLFLTCPHHLTSRNRTRMSFLSFPLFISTMLQLTETTLFHWDSAFEFSYCRAYDLKKDFSGTRKVQSWMAKLPSLLPTQGSSASARSYVSTIANMNCTASLESQHLVTPVWSLSNGLGYHVSDIEASNGAYRHTVGHIPKLSEHFPSLVSDSTHLVWCKSLTH